MSGQLSDAQLEAFDSEFVSDERWEIVRPLIESTFGTREGFTVLDVGGGNGAFADRVLAAFPGASVIVAEPAASLRDRNRPHPRKTCVPLGTDDLATIGVKADLVCFNWVLHHVVSSRYRASRRRIADAISVAASLLADHGAISVFENNYNGVVIPDLPGRATFLVLRLPIVRKLAGAAGANTAGVGVCYLSKAGWERTFARGGLTLAHTTESDAQYPAALARSRLLRAAIGLRTIRVGHYWLHEGLAPDTSRAS